MIKKELSRTKIKAERHLGCKILILAMLFIVLFSVSFASAASKPVDTIKSYDSVNQQVTLMNKSNLVKNIATLKLNTPIVNYVSAGYTKVAEFTINSFDSEYSKPLEQVQTYNSSDLSKEINRKLDYKLLTYVQVLIPAYNDTPSHYETQEKWVDFDYSTLKKGIYTVGIFTNTYVGDSVEWIPTFYGAKINEWATWIVQGNGVTFSGSGTYSVRAGVTITPNKAIYVRAVSQNSGCTSNYGGIQFYNGTIMASAAMNNNWANFSQVLLNASYKYAVFVNSTSGSYTAKYVSVGGITPINETDFQWAKGNGVNTGGWWGDGDNDNIWCVVSIEYSLPASTTNPAVTLNSPVDYYNSTNQVVTFNVSAVDYNTGGGISNVSFFFNGINQSTNISHTNGTYIFIKTLSSGLYNWSILAYSQNGTSNQTATRTLNVTILNQTITLNSPVDYYNTSSATVNFNATIHDYNNGGGISNVSLYLDGSLDTVNTSGVNNTYIFTKVLSAGVHNWSILSYGINGTSTQSATRKINLTISSPVITLTSPVAYYNTSSPSAISFNAMVSDNLLVQNVSLYIDGVLNQTNSTTGNNLNYTFSNTLSEGTHYWSILAYDNESNPSQSANRYLTITFTNPQVILLSPSNYYNSSNPSVTLVTVVTDNYTVQNVSLYLDGSLNETQTSPSSTSQLVYSGNSISGYGSAFGITNNGTYFWTTSVAGNLILKSFVNGTYSNAFYPAEITAPYGITTDGNYIWVLDNNGTNNNKVFKYDMNMAYTGISFNIISTTALSITNYGGFIFAASGSNSIDKYYLNGTYTGSSISVSTSNAYGLINDGTFFFISNYATGSVYRYYTNGTYFDTTTIAAGIQPLGMTNILNDFWIVSLNTGIIYDYLYTGTNQYQFSKTLSEGKHNWSILAFNNYLKSNQSITQDFWVNTTPRVTLNNPIPYANLSDNQIWFNSTIYSVYNIQNVSLYINGILNSTDASGTNGSYNISKYMSDGYYNWSIKACSSLGACNQSDTRYLNVSFASPVITINSPIAYYNSTNQTINFNITTTDNYGLTNLSIIIDGTYWNGTNTPINGTNLFTGIFADGTHTFYVNATNIYGKTASTNLRYFSIDTVSPTVNIIFPSNVTYFVSFTTLNNNTLFFNWTASHPSGIIDKCWESYDNGITNRTIACNSNSTVYEPFGTYTFAAWSNDTFGNLGSSRVIFILDYKIFEDAITYSGSTLSGATESYGYTFNKSSSLTISSVNFVYNGVSYPISFSPTNNYQTLVNSFVTPTVDTPTNYNFYWSFLMSDSSTVTSSVSTQTVNPLSLNCSGAGTSVIMNLTMVDEETLQPVNGTIEVLLTVYSLGTTSIVNVYNKTFLYNSASALPTEVCISNLLNNYSMAYTIRQDVNSSYFIKYRNVQYAPLNNNTMYQNITLYNLLLTSGQTFTMKVTGNTYADNGNLLVDVMKQYIATNTYPTVEGAITSNDGSAIVHLIPSSSIYNFVVSQNGVLLGTFNSYQVQCVNSVCSIPLNLNVGSVTLQNLTNYGNILGSGHLNNATNVLTFSFISTDGNPHNVSAVVYENNGTTDYSICSSSLVSTSGTLSCVIPSTYQNLSFVQQVYSDGTYLGSKIYSSYKGISSADYYGVDILIELLMFTTLVLLFINSPIMIVIGAILGMFFAVTLILINSGSWWTIFGTIIYFVIAGVLIIWQINRRK